MLLNDRKLWPRKVHLRACGLVLASALSGCFNSESATTAREPIEKDLLTTFLSAYARDHGISQMSHKYRYVDLNADGIMEAVVYVYGRDWCGSGGCPTLILSRRDNEYVLMSKISVTYPPVIVLSTSTNGWRDISVRVAGGGLPESYDAILRFDGEGYPLNPTTAPAERALNRPRGEVVISSFE